MLSDVIEDSHFETRRLLAEEKLRKSKKFLSPIMSDIRQLTNENISEVDVMLSDIIENSRYLNEMYREEGRLQALLEFEEDEKLKRELEEDLQLLKQSCLEGALKDRVIGRHNARLKIADLMLKDKFTVGLTAMISGLNLHQIENIDTEITLLPSLTECAKSERDKLFMALKGKLESVLEIAKLMLQENTSIDFITKVTGLSVEQINEIK